MSLHASPPGMADPAAKAERARPEAHRLAGQPRSFTTRLMLVLAVLLLGYGALAGLLARQVTHAHEEEALQRLSHGLARHIIEHWPRLTLADRDATDRAELKELLNMLMVVNPGVQVYRLDADGRVNAYLGDANMVREPMVDLDPVRAFLSGAPLPLRGSDPMGSGSPRLFSAAMFPTREGDARPPGYLYVVLDGSAREQVAASLSPRRAWQGATMAALVGGALLLLIGLFSFKRLTQPLRALARQMQAYSMTATGAASVNSANSAPGAAHSAGDPAADRTHPAPSSHSGQPARAPTPAPPAGDEVAAIAQAFGAMTSRIEAQIERERRQAADHRETMASIAHDLRSPLTALHGHLEAMAAGIGLQAPAVAPAADPLAEPAGDTGEPAAAPPSPDRLVMAALAQSNKVRRLSQQLFELAALQSTEQVVHRERFRLDELVSDAVQKFELSGPPVAVELVGAAPGRLELDGDLQLIERALTNLIDNALRHAGHRVRVSVDVLDGQARVLIEDAGPGLPPELAERLSQGLSLRDPPIRRAAGGIGGLGLAIAQRIATLHGGSLRPLPAPTGGTRLCLSLPLAA